LVHQYLIFLLEEQHDQVILVQEPVFGMLKENYINVILQDDNIFHAQHDQHDLNLILIKIKEKKRNEKQTSTLITVSF
jgi:hypothetical protein